MATNTTRMLSLALAGLAMACAQAALGDSFHGNLVLTDNQVDRTAVIPGTTIRLTVADDPQSYLSWVPGGDGAGTNITMCQVNWSVPTGNLDLTTGFPWTWDDTLVSGWEYIYWWDDVYAGGLRRFRRTAFQKVQVNPLPAEKSLVGITATQFALGTLAFTVPSYGASNNYTITLTGGTDTGGNQTSLAWADTYLLQANGGLGLPADYQFTVIPGGAWRASTDAHWNTGTNWTGGGVPDAAFTALFDEASPVPPSQPTLYQNEGVKGLRFERTATPVAIGTSGGSWVLSIGTGGIKASGGTPGSPMTSTVSAGVTAAGNGTWTVADNNTVSLLGGANIGGYIVTKDGGGTLNLAGPQTHTANSRLDVNAGLVNFNGTQRLATYSGGVISPGLLNVNGGKAVLTATGSKVLAVSGLTVNTGAGAQLDLTDNDMIIHYTTPSPLETVKSLITSGYNGGTWDGPGIITSSAIGKINTYALGYAQNDKLFVRYSTFSGEPVGTNPTNTQDPCAVFVKYTYAGDVNLDGKVDDNDVTIIGLYYDKGKVSTHYWYQGDIARYDGKIDDNDITLLVLNYKKGIGSPLGGEAPPAGPLTLTATPEPATLALLALGAVALLRRRSR